jgi:hypothetical protein
VRIVVSDEEALRRRPAVAEPLPAGRRTSGTITPPRRERLAVGLLGLVLVMKNSSRPSGVARAKKIFSRPKGVDRRQPRIRNGAAVDSRTVWPLPGGRPSGG